MTPAFFLQRKYRRYRFPLAPGKFHLGSFPASSPQDYACAVRMGCCCRPHLFVAPCGMDDLTKLSQDPRVTRRRPESPDPGGACVWCWIERAQRGIDNPALDVVVDAASAAQTSGRFSCARSLLSQRQPAPLPPPCGGRADSVHVGREHGLESSTARTTLGRISRQSCSTRNYRLRTAVTPGNGLAASSSCLL
jgi:hypothetical protein